MSRHVTTVQFDVDTYNRFSDVRAAVSLELRHHDRSLGLAPMLGLLVDHWQQHPPSPEWLKERAALYPKRGRPPKHVVGSLLQNPNDHKKAIGHKLVWRRREESAPHRIVFCKQCNMQWATWDTPTPPARCPLADGSVPSIYTPKRWSKNELLLEGFEADEVDWADQ